jgi:hypothetical protein
MHAAGIMSSMERERLFYLVTTSTAAFHAFSFLTACSVLCGVPALFAWYVEFLPRRGNPFEYGGRLSGVWVPYWVVVLAASVLPTVYAAYGKCYRLRAERAAKGLCPRCGYDLRATLDRCPECGSVAGRAS